MNIKKIAALLIMFPLFSVYGQLNQFLVGVYYQWPISDNSFFNDIKNKYKFNTILFSNLPEEENQYDVYYRNAKNAELNSILHSIHLSSDKSFNGNLALYDLEKYSDQTSYNIMGYMIKDEPFIENISSIFPYSNIINQYNYNYLRYANLFPITSFWNESSLITTDHTYRENYIQRYINITRPNLLSFDLYPIFSLPNNTSSKKDFFLTLYDMALKSSENAIPFIYVLTPYKTANDYYDVIIHDIYWAKNRAEFNYVIYAALAYGAKGIMYWPGFEYVTSRANNGTVIKLEFENQEKEYLADLHHKLIENSNLLLSLNFISVYHQSDNSTICSGNKEYIHPFSLWSNFFEDRYAREIFGDIYVPLPEVATGKIPPELMISFMEDQAGKIYFWLFNKSLDRSISFKTRIKSSFKDVLNNVNYSTTGTISLLPGEAKLFDSGKYSSSFSTSIVNKTYKDSFYPLETANTFTIGTAGTSSRNVVFNSGATKTFSAKKINIKSAHVKAGSIVKFISNAHMNQNTFSLNRSNILENNIHTYDEMQEYDKGNIAYIYPNPLENGLINLYTNLGEREVLNVCIYNTRGQIIKKVKVSSHFSSISINDSPDGIYIISFRKGDNIYNLKVVK